MALREVDVRGFDVVTFGDLKISTGVFEFFSNAANKGSAFQFVEVSDGCITVRTIDGGESAPNSLDKD